MILSFLYLSIFHFLSLSVSSVLFPPLYVYRRAFVPSTSRFPLSVPPCILLSSSTSNFPLRHSRSIISPARSYFHEATEHRPILHLNLVNLPELANELWAWCLILAHEHGRRYTASNASGEGTRVYMCVQSAAKVEVTSPG